MMITFTSVHNIVIKYTPRFYRYQTHIPVRDAVEKLPSKKDPSPAKYRLASESNAYKKHPIDMVFIVMLCTFPGANVFCHIDSTQYHKNQIPQKLEQIVLSSCTHVLFSSADTNFDIIANDWYSSQTNGTYRTDTYSQH